MTNKSSAITAIILLLIIIALLITRLGEVQNRSDEFLRSIPSCEVEDSQDCFWDAGTSGNGDGQSFVDIGGTAYYIK